MLDVLRDASKPLSQGEVVEAANDRSDRVLGMQTVRNVLQNSTAAQRGLIRKVPGGRYGKYELDPARETDTKLEVPRRRQASAQTADLLARVLADTDRPLSASELAVAIRGRFGVTATGDSVGWVLKRSRDAGRFKRCQGARYRLASSNLPRYATSDETTG